MATDGKSLNNPQDNVIPVRAGFAGAVSYQAQGIHYMVRAESCDINAKQEINALPDVDGAIDHTRYWLSPFAIDGNLTFPLDSAQDSDSFAVFERFYTDAVLRKADGNLQTRSENRKLHVRYYPGYSYTYLDMAIDSFGLSVSQGDVLKATVGMKGRGRQNMETGDQPNFDATEDLAPVRAIQFNDIEIMISPSEGIEGKGGMTEDIISKVVRSFDMTINNNTEYVYTLSSALTPYDIIAKKREITGSIQFAGVQEHLAAWAATHETRAQSAVDLTLRVKFGPSTTIDLFKLRGVVFQIETVSITNDLVETVMNYRAYGHQGFNFEAISKFTDTSSSANDDVLPFHFHNL